MKKIYIVLVLIGILVIISTVLVHGYNNVNKQFRPLEGMDSPSVENLTDLSGILEYNNDVFFLNDMKLFFGPDDVIFKKTSPFDYDSDEIIETVFNEISGLIGKSITISGNIDADNRCTVLKINNLPFIKPPKHPNHPDNQHEIKQGNNNIL